MSGIVPRRDKPNAKRTQANIHLKNECNKRNIYFIDNSNINPRCNCNKTEIHLSKSGTNKVIENMLFTLSKFNYWSSSTIIQVSMKNNSFSEINNSKRKKLGSSKDKNLFQIIIRLRSKHPENVSLGNLNVSVARNKIESVNDLIQEPFNIFLIANF